MKKTTALITLIQHSIVLSEDAKMEILRNIGSFGSEQIDTLGRFLALEARRNMKNSEKHIRSLDQIIAKLDEIQKTA